MARTEAPNSVLVAFLDPDALEFAEGGGLRSGGGRVLEVGEGARRGKRDGTMDVIQRAKYSSLQFINR